jgi:hypothetical protein
MDQELFSPYKALMERAKEPSFKSLARRLQGKYEELQRLKREFPEHISRNRERREGKKPRLSKSLKGFLANADRDAAKASTDLKRQFDQLPDERTMLKMALMMEKTDFEFGEGLYDTFHADDRPMADRIRSLQQSMIEDMDRFLGKSE